MFRDSERVLVKTVCHGAVRVPNPLPFLTASAQGVPTAGGSCYACSFQVVANHFGRTTGVDSAAVAQTLDRFVNFYRDGRPYVDSNHGMERALLSVGLEVEPNSEWPIVIDKDFCGAHGYALRHEFHENIRRKLDLGYLIVAEVCSTQRSEFPSLTDHWLVLDGYREWHQKYFYAQDEDIGDCVRKAGDWAGTRLDYDYHLIDSSRATEGMYWLDDAEYFKVKGGASCYFVRAKIEI